MIYKWSENSRQNVQAQVVGEEVEKLMSKMGKVEAQDLVDAARRKNSRIHKMFTWENDEAANNWRKQQARMVLNSLRIIVESSGEEISVISHVSVHVNGVPAYVTTATAMTEKEYRAEVLNDALRSLYGLQKRYNDLLELQPVFDAIAKVTKP